MRNGTKGRRREDEEEEEEEEGILDGETPSAGGFFRSVAAWGTQAPGHQGIKAHRHLGIKVDC